MEHPELWVLVGMISCILIFKYYQLLNAARASSSTIKMYLSEPKNKRRFISEILIYVGLMWILILSMVGTDCFIIQTKFSVILYLTSICLITIGVALLLYNSFSELKSGEIKQRLKSEQELENKVANSKKALYFLCSAPFFIGAIMLIEYIYPTNDGTFLGLSIKGIAIWKLWTVVAVWVSAYLLMLFSGFCLFRMSKHMLNGNLFGNEPLMYLRFAANSIQIMASVLLCYSFFEGTLTEDGVATFLLKPIFWLSYFLLFVSLMLKYLSSVLHRAAKIKEENDLTI